MMFYSLVSALRSFGFLMMLAFLLGLSRVDASKSYTVDLSTNPSPIWSFWETSTTFDHGYQALRQDWRESLLETHLDLGTQFVRFHETFDDDIGIANPKKPTTGNGDSPYSYINIDKIYDYILSIGMKPLVELDMMPSSFVPPQQTSSMYDRPVYVGPPANKTQWKDFITQFFKHLTARYGPEEIATWAFEAWNEPKYDFIYIHTYTFCRKYTRTLNNFAHKNSCANNWYKGNLTSFLETWQITANAIKAVNETYNIGGPATCGIGWIPEFPQWCKDNKVPIDFVSTHGQVSNLRQNTLSCLTIFIFVHICSVPR